LEEAGAALWLQTAQQCENFFTCIVRFCASVANMHQKGVVHRDMHSGNITFSGPDAKQQFSIKLIDFDRMRQEAVTSEYFERDFMNSSNALKHILKLVACKERNGVHLRMDSKRLKIIAKIRQIQSFFNGYMNKFAAGSLGAVTAHHIK